jgi:hypothetical protein
MNYALRYPRLWWVYLLCYSTMVVVSSVYESLVTPEKVDVFSIMSTVIAVVGFWPLLGYVRQRRYSPRVLWIVVLAINGTMVLTVVLMALFVAATSLSFVALLGAAIAALFGGPYLFALYQYVFRSAHLWH